MALMSVQPVSSVLNPTFSAPTTSDTIRYEDGLWLHVKNGATSSTVTVVVPGNQPYSGSAKTDLVATFSNGDRIFYIDAEAVDNATGLVTVTYSSVATVTAGLFKI
jgi:hypothetical protein